MTNRIQILASLAVVVATVTALIPRQPRSNVTPKREPVLFSTKNQKETKSDPGIYKTDVENRSIYDVTRQWEAAKEGASDFWKNVIEGDDDSNNGKDNLEKRLNEDEKKDADGWNGTNQKRDNEDHGFKEESRENVDDENRNQKEKNKDMLDPLKKLLKNDGAPQQSSPATRPRKTFEDAANTFVALLSNKGQSSEQSIRDIVDTARESAEEGEVSDQKSFQEILELLRQYSRELRLTADKYFGTIDFSQLYPTSLFYFIEYEDERKNPSWKRRIHRFHKGVDFKKMNSLNDALLLARLSYYESSQEVRQRLGQLKEPYELVSCDLRASEPGKPAHYLAVKKKQKKLNPALELVLGIRGTKTITDAITDLLFEATEYRNGKAHSGMLSSGRYIAEKNKHLLKSLLESSGKKKVKLKLVGHSLGAGAACIAAMEFNDEDFIEPDVVGFGSPALLSRELSEEMQDYMTTVVADDDCVPRLSAPTVVNTLLDIMEFDYVPRYVRECVLLWLQYCFYPTHGKYLFLHVVHGEMLNKH